MTFKAGNRIFQLCGFLLVGFLLTACELIEKKPETKIEQKKQEKITPAPVKDLNKLSLKEIHNLPRFKQCQKLIAQAEQALKKRPAISVKIKPIKGLPENIDLKKMFFLEPQVEKYPLDASIRSFDCPKKLEEVKVKYNLKKGPSYKTWYYFSYHGDIKGIDTSSPINPVGLIEAHFGDNPPDIKLQIDKMLISSLKPSQVFSNEDLSFVFKNIIFNDKNSLTFNFLNKSQKELSIRKLEIKLGPHKIQVDYKNNIIHIDPEKFYKGNKVQVDRKFNTWYVDNGNKAVRILVNILYKANRKIKKLYAEKYIRLKDLGMNEE